MTCLAGRPLGPSRPRSPLGLPVERACDAADLLGLGPPWKEWYTPPSITDRGTNMKRAAAVCVLVLASGCSTAPVADLLDWLKPAEHRPAPGPVPGAIVAPPGGPRPPNLSVGGPPGPVAPPPGAAALLPAPPTRPHI